jgi:hypothetical protein
VEFLVKTPNLAYRGKTLGILFSNGRAILNELTVDEKVGLTVEELAEKFRTEFGYSVTPVIPPEKRAAHVTTVQR